ncbi:ribosomal RNA methyltransferase [Gracilibacillus halophilus YIM-C55.5]|uniref:Ribosomal RNA methyltransferase n=1 Tax=Gracilibacillus halophilus YIM-C55.5 TaxID=1308866 RepID=N4WMW8_9BACI|nr:methyltransferase [Gracilibacillus halophilus]ENH95865.1 ribosomal RNA methyltransferase [Gracilibacillus halophilus YIM-C55.5]
MDEKGWGAVTDHYYNSMPNTVSDPQEWNAHVLGRTYRFRTDRGVFSKDMVDFGSKTLIETFEEPAQQGDILDLGCGYGPISVVLADVHPHRHVIGSDINQRALNLAKENAQNNQVNNVTFIESNGVEQLRQESYVAIVTNPPIRAGKKVVHDFFEGAGQMLVEGGHLWVVMQKKQGAPSAQKKLDELFGTVELIKKNKGYYIFRAIKQ